MVAYEEQSQNTKDEYGTDPELWRPLADAVNGFDLDPATDETKARIADSIYAPADDGLSQPWHGKVFLNPPFSNKVDWYRKLLNELSAGNAELVVALAPGDTSADWFQRWFSQAEVLGWLDGRNWYLGNSGPTFNTVVGVFGDSPPPVVEVLQNKGTVTKPVAEATQQAGISEY